jgi:hypothetical protein
MIMIKRQVESGEWLVGRGKDHRTKTLYQLYHLYQPFNYYSTRCT